MGLLFCDKHAVRVGDDADKLHRTPGSFAILFAPTLVGTIYGMNFDFMPETHWVFGYPFAIVLMGAVCLVLHRVFKRRNWL